MVTERKLYKKYLIGLSLAVLMVTLTFGLRPKGFYFSNGLTWIPDMPGIRFENYGIAYASLSSQTATEDGSELNSFSIEIALKPERNNQEGFKFILAFHGGRDRDQLIVAQYLSNLIIKYRNKG